MNPPRVLKCGSGKMIFDCCALKTSISFSPYVGNPMYQEVSEKNNVKKNVEKGLL